MFDAMSGAQHPSADVGTDAGGFRVPSAAQGAVRVTAWGYWPPEVSKSFAADAVAAANKLGAAGIFTLEAAELKPQGADGQEALRVLFRALAAATFARGFVLSSNALTRMQLTRLVRESGLDGRIEFGDSGSNTPGA
jgi:hypothetical protein